MNRLEKQIPFSENKIDAQNYTTSLLLNCSINGIISNNKIQEIKSCIENEFVELASQLTKRDSSTISKKKAELILDSILYQSDVQLLSLNSMKLAISELNNKDFNKILEMGRDLILKLNEKSRVVFNVAYQNRLSIKNYEYEYVMNKSFDEFISNYSARFDARNCCATIDYPLLGRPAFNINLEGVLFILEYYTSLMYENLFCKYFNDNDINTTLEKYGKIYGFNFHDFQVNICEVLFNNTLITTLIRKDLFDLMISKEDTEKLMDKYSSSTKEKLQHDLINSFSVSYLP